MAVLQKVTMEKLTDSLTMHRRIILWDGESGYERLSFESSHVNNIFQAKFRSYMGNRKHCYLRNRWAGEACLSFRIFLVMFIPINLNWEASMELTSLDSKDGVY